LFNVQTLKQPAPLAFLLAFAAAFFIAVAGTIHFCHSMSGSMDMPGGWTMSMMWMPMPGYTWVGSAAIFLLMWLAMMVAMMLPSTLPMLLNIRRASTGGNGRNFEALMLFAALGYFFVWMIIGTIIYALGVGYALATMRMDWLSRITPTLSGAMLIICGIIQFTPWKMSALQRCRAPDCGTLRDGSALSGGWRYGFRQGMSCCICCTAPMLALLVLGAMNLAVMAVIAAVIAAEKLLPCPERIARIFGILFILPGAVMVLQALFIG
jgi:predicted metal-binding membrane protein